jgi:hypothetical protein
MKIIIAGTRTFNDKHLLFCQMDYLIAKFDLQYFSVVSGTQDGADKLGEKWAKERNVACEKFPPDWDKYKKAAGPIRNAEMADVADICVVFWDGKSKGSRNMIETALKKGLLVKVIKFGDK